MKWLLELALDSSLCTEPVAMELRWHAFWLCIGEINIVLRITGMLKFRFSAFPWASIYE